MKLTHLALVGSAIVFVLEACSSEPTSTFKNDAGEAGPEEGGGCKPPPPDIVEVSFVFCMDGGPKDAGPCVTKCEQACPWTTGAISCMDHGEDAGVHSATCKRSYLC